MKLVSEKKNPTHTQIKNSVVKRIRLHFSRRKDRGNERQVSKGKNSIYQVPTSRAGKRVRQKQLSDKTEAIRGGGQLGFNRETSKGLVSEQENEMEESTRRNATKKE